MVMWVLGFKMAIPQIKMVIIAMNIGILTFRTQCKQNEGKVNEEEFWSPIISCSITLWGVRLSAGVGARNV